MASVESVTAMALFSFLLEGSIDISLTSWNISLASQTLKRKIKDKYLCNFILPCSQIPGIIMLDLDRSFFAFNISITS